MKRNGQNVLDCQPRNVNKPTKLCFGYNVTADSWDQQPYQLTDSLDSEPSVVLANGTWLTLLAQLETNLIHNGVVSPGPETPHEQSGTCMVRINETHLFFGGGYAHYREAYIIDVDTWEVTRIQDMIKKRQDA